MQVETAPRPIDSIEITCGEDNDWLQDDYNKLQTTEKAKIGSLDPELIMTVASGGWRRATSTLSKPFIKQHSRGKDLVKVYPQRSNLELIGRRRSQSEVGDSDEHSVPRLKTIDSRGGRCGY